MTNRLDHRLMRLERRAAPPWEEWEGVDPDKWPDDVLEAKARDAAGLPPDTELTDELLELLIAQAREKEASDDGPV